MRSLQTADRAGRGPRSRRPSGEALSHSPRGLAVRSGAGGRCGRLEAAAELERAARPSRSNPRLGCGWISGYDRAQAGALERALEVQRWIRRATLARADELEQAASDWRFSGSCLLEPCGTGGFLSNSCCVRHRQRSGTPGRR